MYKNTEFLVSKSFLVIFSVLFIIFSLLFSNFLLATGQSVQLLISEIVQGKELAELSPLRVSASSFFDFQKDKSIYYMIVFILILFSLVKFLYDFKRSYGDINKGQHGTSEFTTLKELKEQYRSVPEKTKVFKGNGGVVISRYKKRLFIDDSPVNNLFIGMTRSGKGEFFVFSILDVYSRARKQPSMVFNDPKGELAAASTEKLKERGYEVKILNLVDLMCSMSYNPLSLVVEAYENGDYSTAQLLANTFSFSLYNDPSAKDKFWQNSAKSLCNALILAITHDCLKNNEREKITMYSVANLLASLGSEEDEEENNMLDLFFQSRPFNDIARLQYATSNFSKGSTRGGIFSTAMDKLQLFTFTEVAKLTSKNSIDLEGIGFGDKPVAVFMVTPDYDSSLHAIPSIFVRQLYYVLSKKATVSKGGKCSRKVVFGLDEFGNMPAIEGMANIITVCLGRNIHFNMFIHSYSQLKKLYGDDSDTITGNCGNQIYILTNDLNTAEHYSKLVGKQTIIDRSRSGKHLSFDKSESESAKERPLLTSNELMSLMEGENVIVRTIKRQDKKRKRIRPKPIYNTGPTTLKARWEYLADQFDTSKSIMDLSIDCIHKNVDVERLLYSPYDLQSHDDESQMALTDQQRIYEIYQKNGRD